MLYVFILSEKTNQKTPGGNIKKTNYSESEVHVRAYEDKGRFATVQALIDSAPTFPGR